MILTKTSVYFTKQRLLIGVQWWLLYKVQTESLYKMEINFSLQRAKHGLMKLSTGKTKTTEQIRRGAKRPMMI